MGAGQEFLAVLGECYGIAMSFAVIAEVMLMGTFPATLWVWRQPGLHE
jgi:hypothetical protein